MQAVTAGESGAAQVRKMDPRQYLTDLINNNKEKDRIIEELERKLEEVHAGFQEATSKLKPLEQFEWLLDDAEMQWFRLPALRNRMLWRNLRAAVQELFGSVTDRHLRAVVEACLEYSLQKYTWSKIKQDKFNNTIKG